MKDTEKRFREIVENKKIDFVLISSPENFYYISGYASHQHTVSRNSNMAAILMSFQKENIFTKITLMDYEYENILKKIGKTTSSEILPYSTWVGVKSSEEVFKNKEIESKPRKTMFDILKEGVLSFEDGKKPVLGIEKDFISLNFYTELLNQFPNCEFVDISKELIYSRSVKTSEEIKIFKNLIKVQDEALNLVMNSLKVGIKESSLAEIYNKKIMEFNEVVPSTWSMFSSGENCSILGLPSEKELEDGDVFKYDGGVTKTFQFYTTDFARSWIVGKRRDELVELKDTLYFAQRLMIENMKPGVKIKEIFNLGFEYVKKRYPKYERGHLGHSISLGPSTWESPLITKDEERVLEKGMILCVEVPLYIKGLGGFNIEDMVLITENEAEILSTTPHFGEKEDLY